MQVLTSQKFRLLVMLVSFIFASFSQAQAREKFVTFPAIGQCTGTYVRYRSDPDTESEIVGRLNAPERVVVFGQTAVDGEVWYEIGDPHGQDSAFVFGKYIKPLFNETSQQSPVHKLIFDILMSYGLTEEHDDYDGPNVRRKYDKAGNLVKIEAWREGCTFGDISIGDEVNKIEEVLGSPDSWDEEEWEYEIEDFEITFHLKNGKITRMIYEED
ncbi:MAG: SH3 domain-containing protein [Synergistaceae bacterium]|nr:SH3 domain-containing protein [Synergistaceae bacterium]